MSHTFKLSYFDGRGRAEIIRLIFAMADKEYEDERFSEEQWSSVKDKFPMGQLPAMQIDGCNNLLSQSGSIARFVACELGLLGSNKWEHSCCDMLIEANNDIITSFGKIFFMGDTEEKKQKLKDEAVKAGCGFAKLVKDARQGKYILGDKATAADLAVFAATEMMECMLPGSAKKHEVLCEICSAVRECPNIAKYLKNRKETPW